MLQEIVKKYIKGMGFSIAEGGDGDITPIMPLLLMDLQYTYYRDVMKDIEVHKELKVIKKKWIGGYNSFNQPSFRIFNKKEKDFLIDLMDELEEYIMDYMRSLRAQIMNCMPDEPFKVQDVYATCAVCNVLARLSLYFFAYVFRDSLNQPIRNNAIKAVQDNAILFGFTYRNKLEYENIAEKKAVDDCITALCKHIIYWMKKKRESAIANEI